MVPTVHTLLLFWGLASLVLRASGGYHVDANGYSVADVSTAGATFPQAAVGALLRRFSELHPDATFAYSPVGSGAGKRLLRQNLTDFALSDSLLSDADYAGSGVDFQMFPFIAGAVVPIYRLTGIQSQLVLGRETLARIFMGNITLWNDDIIVAENSNKSFVARLPRLPIRLCVRADSSGTSQVFTTALSLFHPPFRLTVGASSAPNWDSLSVSSFITAVGTEGLLSCIDGNEGTIGYASLSDLQFSSSTRSKEALILTKTGRVVDARHSNAVKAALSSAVLSESLTASLLDSNITGAYPIVTFSYFVIRSRYMKDCVVADWIVRLYHWIASDPEASDIAVSTGYVSLPPQVFAQVQRTLAAVRCNGLALSSSGGCPILDNRICNLRGSCLPAPDLCRCLPDFGGSACTRTRKCNSEQWLNLQYDCVACPSGSFANTSAPTATASCQYKPRQRLSVLVSREVGIYQGVLALTAMSVLLAAFFFAINVFFRTCRVVRCSSPRINYIVIFGCLLSFAFLIVFGIPPGDAPWVCQTRIWFISFAFTLTFGSLFAKSYRVYKIFSQKSLIEFPPLLDIHLVGMVAALCLVDLVILITWTFYEPLMPFSYAISSETLASDANIIVDYYGFQCTSSTIIPFSAASVAWKGILLLFGVFLAWFIRKQVHLPEFNDSNQVCLCVYNVTVVCVVAIPVGFFLTDVNAIYTVTSFGVLIAVDVSLCVLFIPPVIRIYKGTHNDTSSTPPSNDAAAKTHQMRVITPRNLTPPSSNNRGGRESPEPIEDPSRPSTLTKSRSGSLRNVSRILMTVVSTEKEQPQ